MCIIYKLVLHAVEEEVACLIGECNALPCQELRFGVSGDDRLSLWADFGLLEPVPARTVVRVW